MTTSTMTPKCALLVSEDGQRVRVTATGRRECERRIELLPWDEGGTLDESIEVPPAGMGLKLALRSPSGETGDVLVFRDGKQTFVRTSRKSDTEQLTSVASVALLTFPWPTGTLAEWALVHLPS